jgi:hypothetical protein
MQPFPIPFEPTNLTPCFTLRSRREVNTFDSVNTRLVEHWQTDAPSLQFSRRDVSGVAWWMDMNPTPSRLYREDLRQSQPYVVPAANTPEVRKTVELGDKISQTLLAIQTLQKKPLTPTIKSQLNQLQELYTLYLQEQKQIQVDTMTQNPYFDKYDPAGDSRNVVRELRGAVSEDIVDRGLLQSQRLLTREFDSNRWIPQGTSQKQGIDQLTAFELMRPTVDNININYKK